MNYVIRKKSRLSEMEDQRTSGYLNAIQEVETKIKQTEILMW